MKTSKIKGWMRFGMSFFFLLYVHAYRNIEMEMPNWPSPVSPCLPPTYELVSRSPWYRCSMSAHLRFGWVEPGISCKQVPT